LKFTRQKVPRGKDVLYTAREDEVSLSPWIALPGRKNIGIGRHWHGVITTLWLLTGAIYIVLLFATGEWTRLIPTSSDVFSRAWDSLLTYLSLKTPPLSAFRPYDALQQLAYGDKPLESFYEVIDPILANHGQTILAYELNDEPLPLRHGAPLRLRVETQLGYKMVNYLRSIELIADYRTIEDGQGGSREDTQFMGRGAEI
jgi:hypothetical protein